MSISWRYLTDLINRNDIPPTLPRRLLVAIRRSPLTEEDFDQLRSAIPWTDIRFNEFMFYRHATEAIVKQWWSDHRRMSPYIALSHLAVLTLTYRVPLEDVPLFTVIPESFSHGVSGQLQDLIRIIIKWRLTIGR